MWDKRQSWWNEEEEAGEVIWETWKRQEAMKSIVVIRSWMKSLVIATSRSSHQMRSLMIIYFSSLTVIEKHFALALNSRVVLVI